MKDGLRFPVTARPALWSAGSSLPRMFDALDCAPRSFTALVRFRRWTGLSTTALLAVAAGLRRPCGHCLRPWRRDGGRDAPQRPIKRRPDAPALVHRPSPARARIGRSRAMSTVGSPVALAGRRDNRRSRASVGARRTPATRAGSRHRVPRCPAWAPRAGKVIVGRGRPPVPLHLIAESDPSFPSGHATESTAVLRHARVGGRRIRAATPARSERNHPHRGLLSFAVGTSRLVLGVHWPSDVIAGWALGAATALAVTLAASLVRSHHARRGRCRLARVVARVVRLLTCPTRQRGAPSCLSV